MNPLEQTRIACAGIVAVAAIAAIIILIMAAGARPSTTGAVSTEVCPRETAPIISGERFLGELGQFRAQGYECFFGYDGITPCCVHAGAYPRRATAEKFI